MANYIPPPMRGIASLDCTEKVVKKYGAVGILIGGLSIRLYQEKIFPKSNGKDVDILILDRDLSRIPIQWEHGVDWWTSPETTSRPTNGTKVGLLWNIILREGVNLPSGLYILPPKIIKKICAQEFMAEVNSSDERLQLTKNIHDNQPLINIPVISEKIVDVVTFSDQHSVAVHPKKIGSW